ncbi:alpha/beta hydrolase, partial [bacterium]
SFDPLREESRRLSGELPCSDAYLRFLVEELKPWVDANLPTLPDPAHTGVMGSSMGGLISLYALCRYPQVFGLAGCLSTHFPLGAGQIEEWMRDNLPQPGNHRLYFDFGGRSIDREYAVHHLRVRGFLDAAGWREGSDYLIRQFKGATHNERAWRKRLHIPLNFLFKGQS